MSHVGNLPDDQQRAGIGAQQIIGELQAARWTRRAPAAPRSHLVFPGGHAWVKKRLKVNGPCRRKDCSR